MLLQQQEDFTCCPDGSIKPTPPFDCSGYSMMFFKVLPCVKVGSWVTHASKVTHARERRNTSHLAV